MGCPQSPSNSYSAGGMTRVGQNNIDWGTCAHLATSNEGLLQFILGKVKSPEKMEGQRESVTKQGGLGYCYLYIVGNGM